MRYIKLLSLLIISLGVNSESSAQSMHNMAQLGHMPWPERLSEVRGVEYNGHEYALLGSYSGFSIVDVTDPANMFEAAWFGGAQSIWRDPFYFNSHAYCVTEGGGGMLIVDMSPLPGSTTLNSLYFGGDDIPFTRAHNMWIDENGFLYLFGSDALGGGVMIYDLNNDPMAPEQVGFWADYYVHDGFVRGDTMWLGCVNDGLAVIVDVQDKENPETLVEWATPSNFTHNIWPNDDNSFTFTTDEVSGGYIAAYDVQDLNNIFETDRYNEPLSEGVIPHNVHYYNGFLVTSHYNDGVTIHDAHDPYNLVLTGWFDPSGQEGNGFHSAWGAWPYMPSGNILMSDIDSGLYIIGPTYVEAATIAGNVTEFGTGSPLSGVNVDIVAAAPASETDIFGDYASGTADAGDYTVVFTRAGYQTVTENNVTLVNGQTTVLDVEMVADIPFVLVGQLVDAVTGDPIEGADVNLNNPFFDVSKVSNSGGYFVDSLFYAGNYSVTAGIWGKRIFCENLAILNSGDTLIIEMVQGYEDNFDLDLGWQITGNASAGIWERGVPVETEFDGATSNPGSDAGDCGDLAFVTGNGGGGAGDDDVDDGVTILSSPPMDLSNMAHPFISFSYWFFNEGGNSTPNDSVWMVLENGITTSQLSIFNPDGEWVGLNLQLELLIDPTDNVTISFHAQDFDPGHLVEAGFDDFLVTDSVGLSVDPISQDGFTFKLFPNPASNGVVYISAAFRSSTAQVNIIDVTGRIVHTQNIPAGQSQLQVPSISGVYLAEVVVDGARKVSRLVIE